jgi:hypothetical protein
MRKILSLCILLLFTQGTTKKAIPLNYVPIPLQYAIVMREHIITIAKNGWGEALPGDLYHGHLVLRPRIKSLPEPVTMEVLFQNSAGILYHSDEMLERWLGEDGNLPFEKRRPRSIFGFWNGEVKPTNLLFKDPGVSLHFACCGTIHTDELASERPKEFGFWRSYLVKRTGYKPCSVNFIIDIDYSSLRPKMIEINGQGYTMNMDCK